MTLDLRRRWDCVWDEAMRPIGEGDHHKESFEAWWDRWSERLGHLDPRIAEQWIYRHWRHSYMAFLALEPITWRMESWSGDRILAEVHLEFGGPMAPDHDYKAFNGKGDFGPNATARAMNGGTWDMPLLVLETPAGILSHEGARPDVRFVVAEGSKRMRYLAALRCLGQADGPHDLFVLSTPEAA